MANAILLAEAIEEQLAKDKLITAKMQMRYDGATAYLYNRISNLQDQNDQLVKKSKTLVTKLKGTGVLIDQ